MNDNAKKWVAALRSGEYRQGRGWLHLHTPEDDSYCCLGVACDLYSKETGNGGWRERTEHGAVMFDDGSAGSRWESQSSGRLTNAVRMWLGLTTDDGTYHAPPYPSSHNCGTLLACNDAGASFEEIANIIESETEGLFA